MKRNVTKLNWEAQRLTQEAVQTGNPRAAKRAAKLIRKAKKQYGK